MKRNLHPPHAGFTLVELMVVIAVLAILASMIITGLFVARKHSRVKETLTRMVFIEQAANNYSQDHRDFPPDAGRDPLASSVALGDELVNAKGRMAPYLSPDDVPMRKTEKGAWYPVDAFDSPIAYRHPRSYARKPPKARSIRLYSAGPDGDFTTSEDNIVNWDKEAYPDTIRMP